jgi:hypothetical protein
MTIARFEKAYGHKGVGRSGQGGQAALSLAGKQASVLRSIVKQSRSVQNRSIPKASPPRSTFGSDSSGLASLCALPSTDRLGFRQSCPPGKVPFLGTGPLATLHPAGCGKGGHPQTNRLAYLSTFVFDVAEGKWSRHKGHAGTASALRPHA